MKFGLGQGIGERSGVSSSNNVNKIIVGIAKDCMGTTNGENWTSNIINHLNAQLPTMAAPEYMDKEALPPGLPDLVQPEMWDAKSQPFVGPSLDSFLSSFPIGFQPPGVFNSNLLLPPVDYSMILGNPCNTSAGLNNNNSVLFGGIPYEAYNKNVTCEPIAGDGMSIYPPLQTEQELMNSSEGDGFSGVITFENGGSIPGIILEYISSSLSENNITQQNLGQGENSSPIGTRQTAKLTHWSHQHHYMQHDNKCELQSNWFPVKDEKATAVQGAYKQSRLHSEQLQPTQQSAHYILRSYIMYKDMPLHLRSDVSFLDYMHVMECRDGVCQCSHYHQLASHFDTCNDLTCNICVPAQKSYIANNIPLESRKRINDPSESGTNANSLPPKCEIVENLITVGNDVMREGITANQKHEPDQLPLLAQWPESAALGSHTLEVKRKQENSEQDPVISSRTTDDMSDDHQRMKFNAVSSSVQRPTVHTACDRYHQLAFHIDSYNDVNYNICVPAQESCIANNIHLNSRKRMNDPPGTGSNANALHPKRKKVENSVLDGNDVMQECITTNQKCEPDQLPLLAELPESAALGSNPLEVKRKLANPKQDPIISSTTTEDISDDTQIMKSNAVFSSVQGPICHTSISDNMDDDVEKCPDLSSDRVHVISEQQASDLVGKSSETESKIDQAKLEVEVDLAVDPGDHDSGPMMDKIKMQSAFMANHFSAAQIKEHLASFGHLDGQGVTESVTDAAGQNTCQLCAKEKLLFVPLPLYCSLCENPIKRNVIYYRSNGEAGTRHCFCNPCLKGVHGNNISVRGASISKLELQKEKNNEEKEDSWVECDRCNRWQHRVCGLYNDKGDAEGNAEYICPKCCLHEIESRKCVPLPHAAAFGAKGLPRTNLSDHIEERLSWRLKQEREERAKVLGKQPEEVPGVEGLVVRVVVSVNKQVKVKQQFLDIFQGEDYPTEFPYRSKKIEGVDVCLFGMCVQEFGSDCGAPNERCVYISYIDSVRYFRPEVRATTGESLRTFVYHEILIGYLDYCKRRGFGTCYIWSCPLRKGDDYIFYCHPETQKTPKQDKLRLWYKSVLKKAIQENIVVDYTNLYDQFFHLTGECNTKITAARLPYFDGDFWSSAAEGIAQQLEQGRLQSKQPTKRTLKSMGHIDSDNATKDVQVMRTLGQKVLPLKDNLMVVHLQSACSYCHEVILSGSRWFCNQCKKIQLCSRCFDTVQSSNERRLPTCNCTESHQFSEVAVNDVPLDTKDKDGVLENIFFDSRESFLSNCQRDFYQFATLGHAKHSSMMILYHLIPKPTCSVCCKDVLVERCWHCDICSRFFVCEACYQINSVASHTHNLTEPSIRSISGTQNEPPREQKSLTLERVLDILMHASRCKSTPCLNSLCHKLRKLFSHSFRCKVRASRGCTCCRRVWWILKKHAERCGDSDCQVPRCMDIKKHIEKLTPRREAHQQGAMNGWREPEVAIDS